MPSAKPLEAETYLCTTIRLDENNTYYVTGFDPRAEMGTAHHMLLFGCEVSHSFLSPVTSHLSPVSRPRARRRSCSVAGRWVGGWRVPSRPLPVPGVSRSSTPGPGTLPGWTSPGTSGSR